MGVDPEEFIIEPYVSGHTIMDGDRFLLCSDGLTDMVSEEDIKHIISVSQTAASCTDTLINAALNGGGEDNITVIVCIVPAARRKKWFHWF